MLEGRKGRVLIDALFGDGLPDYAVVPRAMRDSLERVGRLNDGTELTYGLGVGVSRWRGVRAVSHTGSTGGYRAALARYPEQQVAVALLCNLGSINPGAVANRVAALALGLHVLIEKPMALTAAEAKEILPPRCRSTRRRWPRWREPGSPRAPSM